MDEDEELTLTSFDGGISSVLIVNIFTSLVIFGIFTIIRTRRIRKQKVDTYSASLLDTIENHQRPQGERSVLTIVSLDILTLRRHFPLWMDSQNSPNEEF